MAQPALCGRQRLRREVSLSARETSGEPVEQLDRAVELIHGITRGLPASVLTGDELVALGGLLTQISNALMTFTDLLIPPVHHYVRTRQALQPEVYSGEAVALLRDCRSNYLAAGTSARKFHAQLRR